MPLHNESSVAIIILNWNGYEHSRNCLDSLAKLTYTNYQILLVDNASEDNSGARLKEEFPGVILLQNEKNVGFTGGNEVGIKYALKEGFEYVLLLNNDTLVEPSFLSYLVSMAKANPKMGIVQPLILLLEDTSKIWSAGGGYLPMLGSAYTIQDQKKYDPAYVKDQSIDWATGCCMLIPSPVIQEVGSLEVSYFAYFEDVDWSLRIRKAGYQVYLCAKSIIYHEGNGSTKKNHDEGTLSPSVFYLYCRNQLFQLRRHVRCPFSIIAWSYHLSKYIIWTVYFGLRGRKKKLKAVIKGIRDGILLDHSKKEPLCP